MHKEFQPTVYLLASAYNGTLYLGVSSHLLQRIAQHRDGTFEGFSKKYDVHRLVWFVQHAAVEQAILREKQIKKWRRAWKVDLIEEDNPRWRDLAEDFGFEPL
ncbi:MAG: GIY-YIG nuclease family protein [Erythrobacter sp.]|uniref:GIY-YIG nuclease family protein n=1 Tax=Erythrobacter sp. TaxID=1042 RepID=UPI00261C2597|nr:GIY-YIG nuclease family protein [Erythrobacter sp.]MDJ0977842.1 GIY-YIG nuclease family protein [Erythrobacter sp.]